MRYSRSAIRVVLLLLIFIGANVGWLTCRQTPRVVFAQASSEAVASLKLVVRDSMTGYAVQGEINAKTKNAPTTFSTDVEGRGNYHLSSGRNDLEIRAIGYQNLLTHFEPDSQSPSPTPTPTPSPTPTPMPNYPLSGRVVTYTKGIGIGGVTMTVSDSLGPQTLTAVTDVDGNYSFNTSVAGDTLTPSKNGYGIQPSWIKAVSSSGHEVITGTYNFTAIPLPAVQFNSSSYRVDEGDLQVNLVVTRSGDTSDATSVNFRTSDDSGSQSCNIFNGKASSRCDYIGSTGTVSFAPDETSKTISILITDDSYAEGPESFRVTLSDPWGGVLGVATATVTIHDNDPTTGANPIDDARFFVREHYYDFLNRVPDSAGLDFWTNEITSCGSDQQCIEVKRINVSASFFLSIESQNTGYLVERMYKAAYGDATGSSTFGGAHQLTVPDLRFNEFLTHAQQIGNGVVVGAPGWESVLENNKQTFAFAFVWDLRFTTAFPAYLTPPQFVDKLFQNAGVTPSSADRNAAIFEFVGGSIDTRDIAARARALRRVAGNSTLVTNEFNRAFVLMQYFGYLRRSPNDPPDSDYTGYDFWLTKLNQFNGNFVSAEMVKAFIVSTEYRSRFGP